MGTVLATKIRGMSLRTKIGTIFLLVMASFLYQGILKPLIGDTATNTYYFTLDTTAVNLSADGSTTTAQTLNGKISMKTGVYTTSRRVTAASNTTEQSMIRAYGPAYASTQTLTAPAVTIGVRDANGTTNNITWKAYIYDYNPAGAANNGVLLWTSDAKEAHPSVQTPVEFTFTNPQPKDIAAGHRLKVVITCQMASTSSAARFYWGNSTNYSFFKVTEAPYVANSVTVTNLSDYYGGALTSVTQGDSNIPLLQFDLYSNVAGGATWTGGKLDKIGTNPTTYISEDEPGDASFYIYKDADNDGLFETTDTLIGGPYTFSQLTGQTYNLATPQTITATPQRYFVVYNILRTATYNTSIGARIANSTYFTVTGAAGGITNVSSTSSSTPNIQYGGNAVTKIYPADWDLGTSLAGISESGATALSPNSTDTNCITRNTAGAGFPLVGLLNYPAHSCTSVAGQGYSTTTAQSDFIRLYFGGVGYPSIMKSIKGGAFVYRVYTPAGGGTVTLRLFYVTSGGVRVDAPTSATYTTTSSISQTITTSLAGQDFTNVPAGARLGIQIGVTANMRIGLGSSVGAQMSVQETTAENENVDVGNGSTIPNANVYASSVDKVINSFTLSAPKAKTVNSITITGNALFNSTNIKSVRIYADNGGLVGSFDGSDTLIGSTTTVSGNSATISGLNLAVGTAAKKYLVVVNIGDTPNTNVILNALVSNLGVATAGGIGVNNDKAGATLTILPTTTLSDHVGAEPANQVIPWNATATKIDAFGLKTNGGVNDTVTNVTVALSTTSSLPAGQVISDYIGDVSIVTAGGAILGKLTAPTEDDDWQVPVTGLAATTTATDYYVAITPKGNQNITFTVKAMVISLAHSRLSNALVLSDPNSATITLDQQPPTEPSLTAVTGTYHNDVDRAEIDLSWTASTDLSGGAVTYKLVRGLGNAPPPRTCSVDGVKSFLVYQGASLSYTNKGLDEGVSYGYRLCALDGVGNTTAGSVKNTTASIKNRCTELPELTVNPMASYVKAGNAVALSVGVNNKDTGTCAPTTFTLAIVGTDADDSNFTTSSFSENNFIIATNGGSKYTTLNITSKAGAAQGATKTFHLKVTKSSGGETPCPDPIYVTVNKYGTMMHSSMQVGTLKYGSWGLNYDCSTCHSPSTSNIKQIRGAITTPNGSRPVAFSITSTASAANVAGVFGNDNRAGSTTTNVCEVCHHNTRFHQYSASKVVWKDHNNNTDCTKCHSHSAGFKSVGSAGACDDCHGYPPTSQAMLVSPPTNVLFPYATNAGAHGKHDARGVTCQVCHSNANHILAANPLGDKKLNMGFSIKNSNFSGFVGNISSGTLRTLPPANNYAWTPAAGLTIQQAPGTIMTCNVYCHGWDNNGGYNNEPAWTGITQVGCGSCHAATADAPPTSGSHRKHAGSEPGYGNAIACSKCHGFRNYSTSSAHINGNVEWDLSTITATATYRGANKGSTGAKAPTTPGSYGSCANLYCHSNVVQPNNNGVGAPTVFANPTWGTTTTCNSCHPGQPNTTGGHPQHAAGDVTGFDCRICHALGGDANPTNHANGQIDFKFVGLGENMHYSYSSAKITGSAPYGTCYNGNCHGSRRAKTGPTALTWGPSSATPLCDKCHSGSATAGGFYSTAGPNSTKLNTDPQVGAHFLHITSAVTFKYSSKIDCSQCHLKPTGPYSPGHIDTPLPAEINFGTLSKSGVQNGFTSAAHQPGYNFGTRQCSNVWCHGAGMNSNEGTGPYGSAVLDGGAFGSPVVPVWNNPFLTGTSSDCTKCHAYPPPAPMSGYTHWDDNNNRPYIPNQCILCHKHVNAAGDGFTNPSLHINGQVDSCNTCHGRPPINETGTVVPAVGALTTGLAGSHLAHTINPSIGNKCDVCHYNYTQDMPSYKLEIGFNAYGGKVSRGTFWGYSTLSANYSPKIVYFSNRTSTTVRRTFNVSKLNTCENLYCHGGGTGTLQALGGGSNTKPNWEIGPGQASCGSCHGVTGATYKTRGSHARHVGNSYGQLNLDCSNCHGIKVNNYHVNGKVEWEFYSTVKRLNQTAGYSNPQYTPATGTPGASGNTGNLAPSVAYGTCAVYCHSDGRGNYASPLPTWGGAAMNCGSCHKNQTSSWTGSHQKHAANTANLGYAIDCFVCHYGAGSGNPKHVNGSIDVIFNPTVAGASAVFTSGTCKNIACHVSDASNGPTWGNAGSLASYPATCTGCHAGAVGSRDAIVTQFSYDSHHVQRSNGTLQSTDCAMCHWEGDNNGGKNPAYHAGSLSSSGNAVNLVVWNTSNTGAKTPANRPAVSAATFISYTANGSRSSIAKLNNVCLGCHNAANALFQPFGDGKTPKAYSWDGYSIDERYSQATTTAWGKVTGNNTVTKTSSKAYSAHGRADLNQRGWAVGTSAAGESYSNTSGTVRVLCFDCHNSHGSAATGVMSSYSSSTGRNKGAILKSTTNGRGGYTADYIPTAAGDPNAPNKNAYNTGAALCFDCHNTATPSATVPWGYGATASGGFGSTQAIYGYNDTPNFGSGTFANTQTYTYKAGNSSNKGGHLGASSTLTTTPAKPINGMCTPCHDPHGVSPSLGTNQAYAVPMLKGTWVTSPYKQDSAPAATNEARGGSSGSNGPNVQNVGSTPAYNIDQTTMQAATSTGKSANNSDKTWAFGSTASSGMGLHSINDTQFAGLCTGCHNKTALNNTAAVTTSNWKSMQRIHNTVRGWAVTTGTGGNVGNKIHAFTCSKCHTPHNARLPRLLVTNCLDAKHRGRVASGAAPVLKGSSGSSGSGSGRFPAGGGGYPRSSATNPGPWFFGKTTSNQNSVPAITLTTNTQCHNTATAGGTSYSSHTTQQWNSKSPW